MRIDTRLAQIGSTSDPATGAVSYPIYQSTAFRHPELGRSTGFDYSRTKNPTRAVLEQAIAELECGDAGFACSSGMAALQTIFALFKQGDHLIVSLDLYGGTYRLLERVMSKFGITASYVDTNDLGQLEEACTPQTKALLIETPTNPLMMVTNIAKVSAWAKSKGIITIVDNTLLTPYFQRPIELGADIVIHSATKYLGGHNDVLAGVIVTKGKELSEEVAMLHNAIGAVLGPQDSWLLMRGMKTLGVRMEEHEQNARAIAAFLAEHQAVTRVYYPGLPEHPNHELAKAQMRGFGGMISFDVGSLERAETVLSRVRYFTLAESLGAVESLISLPGKMTHASIPKERREQLGITDGLIRLSVGLEDVNDLIDDLAQALG